MPRRVGRPMSQVQPSAWAVETVAEASAAELEALAPRLEALSPQPLQALEPLLAALSPPARCGLDSAFR